MIKVGTIGSWGSIELTGEFDLVNSGQVLSVAMRLIDQGTSDLTIDLSHVAFMGAAGIDALRSASTEIDAAEGRLIIIGSRPLLHQMLEATGDEPLLPRADIQVIGPNFSRTDGRRNYLPRRHPASGGSENHHFGPLELRADEGSTMTDVLREIARDAVRTVPGCSGATICLLAHGKPRTAVVSDPASIEADVAQYTLGEGPCLLAARTAARIEVDRLSNDSRFASFAQLAGEVGIRSALSSPVIVGSDLVGTVNLYSNSRFGRTAPNSARQLVSRTATATSSRN